MMHAANYREEDLDDEIDSSGRVGAPARCCSTYTGVLTLSRKVAKLYARVTDTIIERLLPQRERVARRLSRIASRTLHQENGGRP